MQRCFCAPPPREYDYVADQAQCHSLAAGCSSHKYLHHRHTLESKGQTRLFILFAMMDGKVKGVPLRDTDQDKIVNSTCESSREGEIEGHIDSEDPTGTNATRESENAKSASSGKDSFIQNLGRHETVAVLRSKACVYGVLAIAAALVGAATCCYVADTENAQFEREVSFMGHACMSLATSSVRKSIDENLLCSCSSSTLSQRQ
jgi:hypothetical protein